MASLHKPSEPRPLPGTQPEDEGSSDEAEDDDDDDEEHNNFHISSNPSSHLRNESQPTSCSLPLPLVPSSSRALIPFTGSFPAIPSPLVTSKAAIVALSDARPAVRSSADIQPSDNIQPQADGKATTKASSFDADPDPERKGEGREHKKRSKNWTRPETLTLIRLRTELAPRFAKAGRKSDLWDEIAESLKKSLFNRDAQQCRDKWEKLMAGYKEVRDGVKQKEDNPYYEDLYPLLSGRPPKRDRETDSSLDYPPAKAEPFRSSMAMHSQIHHSLQYQASKSLPVDVYHSQPFKTAVMEGQHLHPFLKTFATDGPHHHPSLKTLAMVGHLHHPSFETLARDGHQQLPHRGSYLQGHPQGSMAMDNHAAPAVDDDTLEERSHVCKQRKASKVLSVTDLHAVQSLLESIIARQQSFFKELLDGIERKEELREQMRQEREERWRVEETAQRHFFTEAMQRLSQKLCGVNGVVEPQVVVGAAVPHSMNHGPLGCSSTGEDLSGKRRSKNWKRSEVLQLIKLRGEMEDKFVKSARRAALWGELAEVLSTLGIRRDGKQCREKWDKLMSEYKDVLDGKKEKGDSPYYTELQVALAGRGGGLDMEIDTSTSAATSKQDEIHT